LPTAAPFRGVHPPPDSHDEILSLSPLIPHPPSHFCPPSFNEGPEVSLRDNFRIKDVCRYALDHYDGLMRLFSLETKRYVPRSISLSPRISVSHCASPEVPLDPLFAVDQKAKINLYGKSGQPAEVNVWSTRQ